MRRPVLTAGFPTAYRRAQGECVGRCLRDSAVPPHPHLKVFVPMPVCEV